MNENRGSRGPGWGLLLLPGALIIAKGARRRRAMWSSAGPSGFTGPDFGHHGRSGGGYGEREPRAGFRLPPRLEQMLDAWHTQAHETGSIEEEPADPAATPAKPDEKSV